MNTPATAQAGAASGPRLAVTAPARPRRAALTLAGAEASRLLRSALVLAGLLAGGVLVWRLVWPAEPLWWNAAWQIGYGQAILAATVLAAAQLAAGRARRDGMQDLYGSFPTSATTRTVAHLAGLAGALPASVLLAGAAAAVIQARGAIGTPSPWVLAAGVLLVIAAGAAGVALGTRFSSPLAGILGALVLLVLFTQSRRFGTYGIAGGGVVWLFPWITQDPGQEGQFPGPLAGYPASGAAHAVELAGIAVLAAVAALAVTVGPARHRIALAVTGAVAAAAICVSGAVQLQPVPTATLNRLVSETADPVSAQHCVTAGQVRYCAYPGFGSLLPAFQAPVRGVLDQVPIRPAGILTVAQAVPLTLEDPPLTHGHSRQQLARWTAELRAAPAGNAIAADGNPIASAGATTAPAIYTSVGYWPSARFTLALRTAEWAVKLPVAGIPGHGCVPAGQAREAIAIWLALTATHASAGQLQAGQDLTGQPGANTVVGFVHNAPVVLWTEPGESYPYVSPGGPQTTAVGFLLAKQMAGLPESKVRSVLDAAWPSWLNPHTSDARLAAALGIPLPRVVVPPEPVPPPQAGLPAPQTPLCTS